MSVKGIGARKFELLLALRKHRVGDPMAKALLRLLLDYSRWDEGESAWICWPSINEITRASEYSRSAVCERLFWLEAHGYISRQQRDRLSTLYRMIPLRWTDL